MNTTTNLGLPYIMASQAQKHVTHNEAIRDLDALVHLAVLDRDLTVPPGSPADGDRYLVAASATGAWSGKDGQIAAWQDGAWVFHTPKEGWACWIADEDLTQTYDGSAWVGSFGNVSGPISVTDNAISRFDGTGGKTLQNSGITIDDSDGMAGVTSINNNPLSGMRSKIINGDFDIWQRTTSFVAIVSNSYAADRWKYGKSGDMVHTVQRSTDVPAESESGHASNYSLLIDCTTVDSSIAASDFTLMETSE